MCFDPFPCRKGHSEVNSAGLSQPLKSLWVFGLAGIGDCIEGMQGAFMQCCAQGSGFKPVLTICCLASVRVRQTPSW